MQRILEQPKLIIVIFLAIAVLMISSALIELYQSKNELYSLMEKQSHSLLELLIIASRNALQFNQSLESSYRDRLLNNANLIKVLYENGQISSQLLSDLAKENDIYRINIFDQKGEKIFSSHKTMHSDLSESNSGSSTLKPIFDGLTDTLIIGLKPARFEGGYRYAIALATDDRAAIVLNINADRMLKIRRETGFGALMRDIIGNPGIVFVALQDTNTILAASGNVSELESVRESPFLTQSLQDSLFLSRITEFEDIMVFEATHPFIYNGRPVGILRLGLSLEPLEDINARIYRRLLVITVVLIVLGSIFFTFIFFRQRFELLEKQYHVVETYSGDIIKNVSDAIVVYDQESGIKIYNQEANRLFNLEKAAVIGKKISEIFSETTCADILEMQPGMQQINCTINGADKYLLLSKSSFVDNEEISNTILVIRDLTQQKQLENQIQRNERLSAMGELASGVAHEIRNPLNTIGTIIQQLDKDFVPAENSMEYHELAQLVYKEVKRINQTINEFLRFSRPEPLHPEKFTLADFFQSLKQQYQAMLDESRISFNLELTWHGEVFWDRNQMRQVFMNLIQNSVDAISNTGEIKIKTAQLSGGNIEITFSDTGPGIDVDKISKIFNLYFTTKAQGTGIGLSIVQRIIYEHNGVINLIQSNYGTVFAINLPVRVLSQR